MTQKILVVDDSAMLRKLLIRELPDALLGDVSEAADGDEALEICRKSPPDMVFLDLHMPHIDGFHVLSELKRMGIESVVIAVSADVQEGAKKRALELGAAAFLQKPFDQPALRSILVQLGLMPS